VTVGLSVKRREDERLLCGNGAYLEDLDMAGALTGVVLRSPYPHAQIVAIDTTAARALPGVRLILTGKDLALDGIGPIGAVPAVTLTGAALPVQAPDYTILARDVVRYVGDIVAFVVADDRDAALAACGSIAIDYEMLPVVTDPADPAATGGYTLMHGDPGATAAAFAAAAHVSTVTVTNPRVTGVPMETRGAWAHLDGNRIALTTGTQAPHLLRRLLAADVFGMPESGLRVITPDVGGGFGVKAATYREQALVVWAARRLGRAVKWVADRSEAFLSDTSGRDMVTTISLALSAEGKVRGLRADVVANLGAYLSYFAAMPANMGLAGLVGTYDIPAVEIHSRGRFTNTGPVCAYRGAGRPEAIYAIERAMDKAARDLGLSPMEIRRRNVISAEALPKLTPMGTIYESGDFPALLHKADVLADIAGFTARRAAAAQAGRLRGMGVITYIERCAGGAEEAARIMLDGDGGADVMLGTMTAGQGHATAYTQMVASRLALDPAKIRIHQGDTDVVSRGVGTFGSRSLPVGGSALHRAVDAVIEMARPIAADLLEAAVVDLEFHAGSYVVAGTDRAIPITEVARHAALQPGGSLSDDGRMRGSLGADLAADGTFKPMEPTYPNGCHVCEVEIDPETGEAWLDRYTAVDDFGNEINPLLVDGQVHGGLAQGIGQGLLERVVYDDDGQLVTGSFMDYAMPRASDMPDIVLARSPHPCLNNPLGLKGCGEAGATAAPPAVMNALLDALAALGVTHMDMPATPERIWRAMELARTDA
jgi:carbon-monoxide dehydrogenase large subunit